MKRIGILTAGGDTPALNATIHGAVARANELKLQVYGLMKGFNSLFNPRLPHVHLNPLFQSIPEIDPTAGGTILGASRDYIDPGDTHSHEAICRRLRQLGVDGLICVGGDGTLNGIQTLVECLPVVLAPKTIDNDLGLNYESEPDEWVRQEAATRSGFIWQKLPSLAPFELERMINFVTPGFVTAVFVSAAGVRRIRSTAESHRRIAIIEVMGRHSGYVALGSAYGQPDIIVVPEHPLDVDLLVERIQELYSLQKNVVIVCGEGIVDSNGNVLGEEKSSTDPAGNRLLSGAAEELRQTLIERIGDKYFKDLRRGETAREVIFTRKVGHTQRGGRPLHFDRFYAAQLGAKAVELLLENRNNMVATLQWDRVHGLHLSSYGGNRFRDRWGHIHPRQMHPSFYDAQRMKPSRMGIEYLSQIFSSAIGQDDVENMRDTLFTRGNLVEPYHSLNTDVGKRIRYLAETDAISQQFPETVASAHVTEMEEPLRISAVARFGSSQEPIGTPQSAEAEEGVAFQSVSR
jgi:ATP-dependent phosphofructokinase / diphosphate-dependent phosphofructokinase